MILFRYLFREIYLLLLIIIVVLISVVIINQLTHFLLDVASGKYNLSTAVSFTGLQFSLILTYILPLALFLAILLAMSRLYRDHEITVMSACGMSLWQQTLSVMSLVCIIALFSSWLSLWVNPRANLMAQNIAFKMLTHFKIDVLVPGEFEYVDNTRMIYVQRVSHLANTVGNVFLAEKSKSTAANAPPVWEIIHAKNVYQTRYPGIPGIFLVLQKGIRYSGSAGHKALVISTFDHYGISMNSPLLLGTGQRSQYMDHRHLVTLMKTSELYPLTPYDPLVAAEWQLRIAIPISIIISSLVALALSEVNPRRGRYFNLLPALALYFMYSSVIFLSQSWIRNGEIPLKLGMWWIHAAMLCIVLLLFGYRMGWQRLKRLLGFTCV